MHIHNSQEGEDLFRCMTYLLPLSPSPNHSGTLCRSSSRTAVSGVLMSVEVEVELLAGTGTGTDDAAVVGGGGGMGAARVRVDASRRMRRRRMVVVGVCIVDLFFCFLFGCEGLEGAGLCCFELFGCWMICVREEDLCVCVW